MLDTTLIRTIKDKKQMEDYINRIGPCLSKSTFIRDFLAVYNDKMCKEILEKLGFSTISSIASHASYFDSFYSANSSYFHF